MVELRKLSNLSLSSVVQIYPTEVPMSIPARGPDITADGTRGDANFPPQTSPRATESPGESPFFAPRCLLRGGIAAFTHTQPPKALTMCAGHRVQHQGSIGGQSARTELWVEDAILPSRGWEIGKIMKSIMSHHFCLKIHIVSCDFYGNR